MRLLLIGCTGFVGRELVPQLLNSGHQITLVSRKKTQSFAANLPTKQLRPLKLDPADRKNWSKQPLVSALAEAEGVINLAGEPIAEKRWTVKHCQKLTNSRLETTDALVEAMGKLRRPPRVLVNASAVGFYGTSQDALFNEQSPCGQDFLGNLCEQWENSANKKPKSTRLVVVRIGIVVGPDGGALGKMLPVFRAGLGGPLGKGQQWMSWIHRSDLCQLIETALKNNSWSGAINAVSPEPSSMAEFADSLGSVLGRPSFLPVPGPILKLLLGDGAKVVLEGQHVESNRLDKLGFKFLHPKLKQALNASIKG